LARNNATKKKRIRIPNPIKIARNRASLAEIRERALWERTPESLGTYALLLAKFPVKNKRAALHEIFSKNNTGFKSILGIMNRIERSHPASAISIYNELILSDQIETTHRSRMAKFMGAKGGRKSAKILKRIIVDSNQQFIVRKVCLESLLKTGIAEIPNVIDAWQNEPRSRFKSELSQAIANHASEYLAKGNPNRSRLAVIATNSIVPSSVQINAAKRIAGAGGRFSTAFFMDVLKDRKQSADLRSIAASGLASSNSRAIRGLAEDALRNSKEHYKVRYAALDAFAASGRPPLKLIEWLALNSRDAGLKNRAKKALSKIKSEKAKSKARRQGYIILE